MELYFLRHGKAVEPECYGKPEDFGRPLTDKGVEELEAESEAMRRLGIEPDVVLTSPLVRAKQTAEIVAKRLGLKKKLIQTDLLAPGCDLDRLRKLLDQHAECASVMLVGHEPDFSTMVGELIARGGAKVELKKGGFALVETDPSVRPGSGTLKWLVSPKAITSGS